MVTSRISSALVLGLLLGACSEPERVDVADAMGSQPGSFTYTTPETTPLDLLIVLESSQAMCDQHVQLIEGITPLARLFLDQPLSLRIAVISTDPTQADPWTTTPGDVSGCLLPADLSDCDALRYVELPYSGGLILARDMLDLLRPQLTCALARGRTEGPAQGLDALRNALAIDHSRPPEERFVRDEATLAVVFVADSNDCSDGSTPDATGPLREGIADGASFDLCEHARNLEDSCLPSEANLTTEITIDGDTRTAYAWCIHGDRGRLIAHTDELETHCPPEGCANRLTPRRAVYEELVALKGSPDALIIETLIHSDDGLRYDPGQVAPTVCGDGHPGYRYALFAQMFPQSNRLAAPLCVDNPWQGIAPDHGHQPDAKPLDVCFPAWPHTCEADADCPTAETCSLGPFMDISTLAGTPDLPYRLCSGFEDAVAIHATVEGITAELDFCGDDFERCDYIFDFSSFDCLDATGIPIAVGFTRLVPPGTRLELVYPGR